MLTTYASESYGDVTFSAWVILPLRPGEPRSVGMMAWGVLDELVHRVVLPPPPKEIVHAWLGSSTTAAIDDELMRAWETSLVHGRLGRAAKESFLRVLAVHHLGRKGLATDGTLLVRMIRQGGVGVQELCEALAWGGFEDAEGVRAKVGEALRQEGEEELLR